MKINDIKHIDSENCYWQIGNDQYFFFTESSELARLAEEEYSCGTVYHEPGGGVFAKQFKVDKKGIAGLTSLLRKLQNLQDNSFTLAPLFIF
jgi:hypothetical protein